MRPITIIYIFLKLISHCLCVGLLLLFIGAQPSSAQTSGLQFAGHEVTLDERTQLNLTPDKALPLKSPLELSFDLKFEPNLDTYFGYIFRMVLGDKNIDLMHANLPHTDDNFQLIVSE